jgi:hypothetical protein
MRAPRARTARRSGHPTSPCFAPAKVTLVTTTTTTGCSLCRNGAAWSERAPIHATEQRRWRPRWPLVLSLRGQARSSGTAGMKAGHRRRRPASTSGVKTKRSSHEAPFGIRPEAQPESAVHRAGRDDRLRGLPLGPSTESAACHRGRHRRCSVASSWEAPVGGAVARAGRRKEQRVGICGLPTPQSSVAWERSLVVLHQAERDDRR